MQYRKTGVKEFSTAHLLHITIVVENTFVAKLILGRWGLVIHQQISSTFVVHQLHWPCSSTMLTSLTGPRLNFFSCMAVLFPWAHRWGPLVFYDWSPHHVNNSARASICHHETTSGSPNQMARPNNFPARSWMPLPMLIRILISYRSHRNRPSGGRHHQVACSCHQLAPFAGSSFTFVQASNSQGPLSQCTVSRNSRLGLWVDDADKCFSGRAFQSWFVYTDLRSLFHSAVVSEWNDIAIYQGPSALPSN